ncbi:MAG: hypothetical protein ACI4DY_04450 [Monoglobaceae bacterium]
MGKKTELSKDQKDLLKLLIACGANENETIGIMLLTQRDYQTEVMIDYIIDNFQTKTVSDVLSKAVEISKMEKEKKEETETIVYLEGWNSNAHSAVKGRTLFRIGRGALGKKRRRKASPKP